MTIFGFVSSPYVLSRNIFKGQLFERSDWFNLCKWTFENIWDFEQRALDIDVKLWMPVNCCALLTWKN